MDHQRELAKEKEEPDTGERRRVYYHHLALLAQQPAYPLYPSHSCARDLSPGTSMHTREFSDDGVRGHGGNVAGMARARGRVSDIWVSGPFDVLATRFPHRKALISKLNFLGNREDAIVRRYAPTRNAM